MEDVVHEYQEARRRLLVFGYNATLTTGVEQAPRQPKRHFDNLMVRFAFCLEGYMCTRAPCLARHLQQAGALLECLLR